MLVELLNNMIQEYRKTKSRFVGEKTVQLYNSIERKRELLGKDFHKTQVFISRLKKKLSINENQKIPSSSVQVQTEYKNNRHIKATSSGKTSSVINLSYRIQKFLIRKYLLKLVEEEKFPVVEALTLPGTEWIFERDLLIQNECGVIVGLENDPVVFKYGQLNMPSVDTIVYLNISDREFFSKDNGKECLLWFDLIWLDYMGPFSLQRLKTFELALKNGYLKDKCLVAFTFMCGRETKEVQKIYKEFYSLNSDDRLHEARKTAIPALYKNLAEKYGYRVEIKKVEIYREEQGNAKAVPMIFIAMKLERDQRVLH